MGRIGESSFSDSSATTLQHSHETDRQPVIVGALCGQVLSAEARRPNVIFILTDDQGWGDAHFAGHPYVKTPNLDRFASQSTWFKQFYVAERSARQADAPS